MSNMYALKVSSIISQDTKIKTTELLFLSAEKKGLNPVWLSEKKLFVITTSQGERYISVARSTLNAHANIALVKNKFHTRLILERFNLPNIPYARPKTMNEAIEFLHAHKTIILKPVLGEGSRDINIVSDVKILESMNFSAYIFEKYISGKEMRYLVLGGEVVAVHHSEYGISVAENRPRQQISFAEESWDPELISLSLKIAKIFRLDFAAIDFLVNDQTGAYILEVNSTPDLMWFNTPTAGPPVDVASLFIESLLTTK